MIRFFLLLFIVFCSGCASTGNQFSCGAARSPTGCQPLSSVDKLIDQGVVGNQSVKHKIQHQQTLTPPLLVSHKAQTSIRIAETRLSVWVAPFVDQEAVMHRQQWLDLVVVPAYWQAPEITESGAK